MLKVFVDATPLSPTPSGVGFYVANLIHGLYKLQVHQDFQLGVTYQPRLQDWLCQNLKFPESLNPYSNRYLLPLPVRITNFLLENFTDIFSLYLNSCLPSPTIVHGTNYNVYPYKNSFKA
ncbi:MAG: hypothetical protein RLP12_02725, partial [Ekhidna sp.]